MSSCGFIIPVIYVDTAVVAFVLCTDYTLSTMYEQYPANLQFHSVIDFKSLVRSEYLCL